MTGPDPRFVLANERTLLAYVRTALALAAGALAVRELLPGEPTTARRIIALGLVGLAAVAVGGGFARWRGAERALRSGVALPPTKVPALVAVGTIVVVAATVVVVLT